MRSCRLAPTLSVAYNWGQSQLRSGRIKSEQEAVVTAQSSPPGSSGVSWHLRKIVDIADRVSRRYHARKYRTWAKTVGRGLQPSDEGVRGFIVIQIDAVAHTYLLQAMERGYAPFLSGLVSRGEAKLAPWRCGQPTTTPAVQAGIMFGENFDIPWYEKENRASVVCKSPGFMADLQQRISEGHPGILTGGSSYVNMFDGGAALSLLTLGSVGRHRFFENMRGVGFLILLALSPWRMGIIVARALWEYLRHLWRNIHGLLYPSLRRSYAQPSPFLNIANDVVFREIQTFAAMLDVYRGVPSIYTNFNSYDDIAHHFGADSPQAFRTLRGIDKQIQRIDRVRRFYTRRQYDLYVLSDHGMTPSMPFKHLYGLTLGQWIQEHVREPVLLDEMASDEDLAAERMHLLLDELKGVEERLGPYQRPLLRRVRRFLGSRIPPVVDTSDWDLKKRSDIVVRNSGSAAHVYFNVAPRRLTLGEITLLYPDLLQNLVEHPGIGMVVACEDDVAIALGKQGQALISHDGVEVEGQNPLELGIEPAIAAEQISYLASFPHSGDLIVFGGWQRPGVIVAFEDQISTHGGIGGPQGYPFILYPANHSIPIETVTNSRELYPFFANLYLPRVT
jgi:hypothetical protein